jgi:hypothetical protein
MGVCCLGAAELPLAFWADLACLGAAGASLMSASSEVAGAAAMGALL